MTDNPKLLTREERAAKRQLYTLKYRLRYWEGKSGRFAAWCVKGLEKEIAELEAECQRAREVLK